MNRLLEILYKFCSVKGLFVIMSSIGLLTGRLSEITFTLSWATFIGSRELWKHLKSSGDK